MKLLVAGDTHGDPKHMLYLMEQTLANGADRMLVVGDFGYWEHLDGGVAFLDLCSEVGLDNDLSIYFIDGNHENHAMLRALYGPDGRLHKPTPEGFWEVRPNLYYIPRGTRWNWNGVELMGLGGAYSVDKEQRLEKERKDRRQLYQAISKGRSRLSTELRGTMTARQYGGHTRWWPEEELTDEEVEYALRDPSPIDILFCHDKPRASNPDWDRKDFLECLPNQDKIQTVIRSLTPSLVVHGHLHHHYADTIRSSDTTETTVIGLNCEPHPNFDRGADESWMMLDLVK